MSSVALPETHIDSANAAAGLFSSARKRNVFLALLLALLTLAVYNPVVHNDFINIDDNGYVMDNQHVHSGLNWGTLKWAFTTFDCENWHPLTWISHALDWQLFGKNPAGHHYSSVLLQAINAVLLFWLLQSATGFTWRSLIVAALFALHPVNVESVAWAAERKNVLSMTFFLLAVLAYGWYAERVSLRRYSAVFLLFACGLMAKPQVITLPFVLLLWDYWPLQRFGSIPPSSDGTSRFKPAPFLWLVLEKIPLLLLAAGDAWLTLQAQHKAVRSAVTGYPFSIRLGNTLVAYVRYVSHAFWPFHLSPTYPHPGTALPMWQAVAAGILLLASTSLVVASRKRYLLVGWFWFLGTLVPMIGIVQVGDQAMADRYAYIPFIGLFWMATWSLADATRDWHVPRNWLAVPVCVVVAGCGLLTHRQITYWHDGETLWRYALRIKPDDFMAHSYLAALLTIENRHEEAITEYLAAERLHKYPLPQIALFADYELRHEHLTDAVAHANFVLAGTDDKQSREIAFRDLGIANTKLGKPEEAKQDYQSALRLDPDDPFVLIGMGLLAYRAGDFPTATDYFSQFVRVEPNDLGYCLVATTLEKSGRITEANAAYAQAQHISSNWQQTKKNATLFLSN